MSGTAFFQDYLRIINKGSLPQRKGNFILPPFMKNSVTFKGKRFLADFLSPQRNKRNGKKFIVEYSSLTFQATVAICNTGVFQSKFISVIITDPAKSYCAPSALCWRFQSKRVIRSRVRSEFPRKMDVVLFVGEKIILFGYHSFSTTMWQNFALESGLSNVPQILPFL